MSASAGSIQPLTEIGRNGAQATVPLRDDNLAALQDRPDVKSWRTVPARYLKY